MGKPNMFSVVDKYVSESEWLGEGIEISRISTCRHQSMRLRNETRFHYSKRASVGVQRYEDRENLCRGLVDAILDYWILAFHHDKLTRNVLIC